MAASRILIVTPAAPHSHKGNRVTADRWARIMRLLGRRVQIAERFADQPCDALIALHIRKSAVSIRRFHEARPGSPIVIALTGTDLYGGLRHSESARRGLELASRLVLLQPDGIRELPARWHDKVRVIYQSAVAPAKRLAPLSSVFEVCVSGHLRPVKDPFRAAMAVRRLPASSRIRVTHIGAALTPALEDRARQEMQRNGRYRWLGEIPHVRARQLLARSRLLVVSSKIEGGANVISEALAAEVPVLSSRISGSVGMLGEEYAGYFAVGDTRELRQRLLQCESDKNYYRSLQGQCRRRADLFRPQRETAAWQALLDELALE